MDEIESKITEAIHDIFLKPEYNNWVADLDNIDKEKWHSLLPSLDRANAPLKPFFAFEEKIYSRLVFRCVKAPDFTYSKELMVLFNLSGSMWHSLIWHKNAQQKNT